MRVLLRPRTADVELERVCDAPQALLPRRFAEMMVDLRRLADALGRGLAKPARLPVSQQQCL